MGRKTFPFAFPFALSFNSSLDHCTRLPILSRATIAASPPLRVVVQLSTQHKALRLCHYCRLTNCKRKYPGSRWLARATYEWPRAIPPAPPHPSRRPPGLEPSHQIDRSVSLKQKALRARTRSSKGCAVALRHLSTDFSGNHRNQQ